MANPYYTLTNPFQPNTLVRSGQVNAELSGVEAGFDLLPIVAAGLKTGTTIVGTEAQGADVNKYEVTMSDTRTANNAGDRVGFFATHTNDGVASPTLKVDALSAVNMVGMRGEALVSGDILNGIFYMFVFNGAAWQMTHASASLSFNIQSAKEWATRAVDDLIPATYGGNEVDEYSARHWATKAASSGRIIAATFSTPVVVNNSTTGVELMLAPSIPVSSIDKFAVEIFVKGEQALAAVPANINIQTTENGNSLPAVVMDYEIDTYTGLGTGGGATHRIEDASHQPITTQIVPLTTSWASPTADSQFVIKGRGVFAPTSTGSMAVKVLCAQNVATAADTTFEYGWIKVSRVDPNV